MKDDKRKDWEFEREDASESQEAELPEIEAHEFGSEAQTFHVSGAERPIAYIRPVTKEEVEGALPPGAPEGPYFALHDEDGRPLALFSDADSAWAAAKANNLETVSLH